MESAGDRPKGARGLSVDMTTQAPATGHGTNGHAGHPRFARPCSGRLDPRLALLHHFTVEHKVQGGELIFFQKQKTTGTRADS